MRCVPIQVCCPPNIRTTARDVAVLPLPGAPPGIWNVQTALEYLLGLIGEIEVGELHLNVDNVSIVGNGVDEPLSVHIVNGGAYDGGVY